MPGLQPCPHGLTGCTSVGTGHPTPHSIPWCSDFLPQGVERRSREGAWLLKPTAGRTGWPVAVPLDTSSRTCPSQGPSGHNSSTPTPEPFLTGKALLGWSYQHLVSPGHWPRLSCHVGGSLLQAGTWVTASPSPGKGSPEEGWGGGLCAPWAWGGGGAYPRRRYRKGGSTSGSGATSSPRLE